MRSSQRLRMSRRLLRFAPAVVAPRSAVAHLLRVRRSLASPVNEAKDILTGTKLLKRRLIIVAVVILILAGFCAAFVYRYRTPRPLTQQEIRDVTSLVSATTSEPISSMQRRRDGTIKVETRIPGHGGQMFLVSRSATQWQLEKASFWIE